MRDEAAGVGWYQVSTDAAVYAAGPSIIAIVAIRVEGGQRACAGFTALITVSATWIYLLCILTLDLIRRGRWGTGNRRRWW